MKKTTMRKSIAIGILLMFISISFFSVNGDILEIKQSKFLLNDKQEIDLNSIFFNPIISSIMKLVHYPSLSACIINGDEVIWSEGYGYYDLEYNKPATENTIYLTASISKTITGTALMQLLEQGLFDLDEDVNNYLPFNLRNPYFPDDPITFKMLLSHTSSLNTNDRNRNEYYWFNFSDDPPFNFFPDPYLQEFLVPGGIYYHEQVWSDTYKPGDNAMYANVGFDLISYLIELISNESFIDYCDENIFNPLGMKNTSFNLSKLNIDNVAVPYHYYNGKYFNVTEFLSFFYDIHISAKYWRLRSYPAGGMYTTISDLSHFLIAHMNNGIYQGVRILDQETVQLMHEIQEGNEILYGLAWRTFEYGPFDISYSGHNGGYWGVRTHMYYIPNEDIGIISFANGDSYSQSPNIRFIEDDVLLTILSIKAGLNILPYIVFGGFSGYDS